ncbi:hypothetical protein Tco_0843182, partial [Tanacetum coccineum]
MLKVAKLSKEPEQSLIPPSGEVNVDDTTDKSLSRASVQPVTQPKAPTDLMTKKKKIPPSSKPESPYKVRVILPKKAVAETQHAKVTVATADDTRSLVASELAQDQGNQPLAADAEKVQDQKNQEVKESELDPMEDVTFDQIMDEIDQRNKDAEKAERSQRSVSDDHDVIDITPKDDEGDASDSGLCSMPDDDLASLTAQSDPLGHLHKESCLLNKKVNRLKSNITKQVSVSIQSFMPLIIADTLKEHLPGLLSDALKDTLPQLIKDSIKNFVSKSIAEELPQIEAQDLRLMFKDMFSLLEAAEVFKKANTEGEKWEKNNPEYLAKEKDALRPDQSKGEQESGATTTAIDQGEQSSAQEKSLGEKDTNDEPPVKKLKFIIPTSSAIPSQTPLNSIMPELLQKPDANKMTMDQFTEHLTNTTSSIFSPSLPREPTPPRNEQKGKGIATEDLIKDIMPFMKEGGSALKILSFKSFVIPEGQLTQEDVMAQHKEMKRLAYLKAEKEKSEKSLKKILNPATIKAQTQKMAMVEQSRPKGKRGIPEFSKDIPRWQYSNTTITLGRRKQASLRCSDLQNRQENQVSHKRRTKGDYEFNPVPSTNCYPDSEIVQNYSQKLEDSTSLAFRFVIGKA